jgi:hypothetical protein
MGKREGNKMGRPERHDVDYFPFFAKRGRTLNILQSKFGLEGIGFFTNLMRFLALTPDHYYCIDNEADRMNFFAEIGIHDENKGIKMIELMVKTEKLDKELWEAHKVIACDAFLKSLEEAYKKRNNKIITIAQIRALFEHKENGEVSGTGNPEKVAGNPVVCGFPSKNEDNNLQSKVKKSKVKKSKYTGGSDEPKKPLLREREPENDYERVEKAYLQNWDILYSQGKAETQEPIVNWKQIRFLLKKLFEKLKPEQIILAINNGLNDDWVMNNGYSFGVILSASVLNRLINAEKTGALFSKQGHHIANDNVADEDISKYFREA